MEQGIPEMPDESSGITYTRRIAELRKERGVKKAEELVLEFQEDISNLKEQ